MWLPPLVCLNRKIIAIALSRHETINMRCDFVFS